MKSFCLGYSESTKEVAVKLFDTKPHCEVILQNLENGIDSAVVDRMEKRTIYALIIVIADNFVKTEQFASVVKLAQATQTRIVLVDDVESENFPSYGSVSSLDKDIKNVFNDYLVPYFRSPPYPGSDPNFWFDLCDKLLKDISIEKSYIPFTIIFEGAVGHHVALVTSLALSQLKDNRSIRVFCVTDQSANSLVMNKESTIFLFPNQIKSPWEGVKFQVRYSTISRNEVIRHLESISRNLPKMENAINYDSSELDYLALDSRTSSYFRPNSHLHFQTTILNEDDCEKAFKGEISWCDVSVELAVHVDDKHEMTEYIEKMPYFFKKTTLRDIPIINSNAGSLESLSDKWKTLSQVISVGTLVGHKHMTGVIGAIIQKNNSNYILTCGLEWTNKQELYHPYNSKNEVATLQPKYYIQKRGLVWNLWQINRGVKSTLLIEASAPIPDEDLFPTRTVCYKHKINRLLQIVYFKTPDGWREGRVMNTRNEVDVDAKEYDFILVKTQGSVPYEAVGSGLYSDTHSGYLCFHGILVGQSLDKYGNTDLYFSTAKDVVHSLTNEVPLVYSYSTYYLLEYFVSNESNLAVIPMKINEFTKNTPYIVDVVDFLTISEEFRSSVLSIIYEVNNKRKGIIVKSIPKELTKNVVPYFHNDKDRSVECLIRKINGLDLLTHAEIPYKTHIYLSYNGFISQQAALNFYSKITKHDNYQVFNNILYDEVSDDYHMAVVPTAKLFVLFLDECWSTKQSEAALEAAIQNGIPIIVFQKERLDEQYHLKKGVSVFTFPSDFYDLGKHDLLAITETAFKYIELQSLLIPGKLTSRTLREMEHTLSSKLGSKIIFKFYDSLYSKFSKIDQAVHEDTISLCIGYSNVNSLIVANALLLGKPEELEVYTVLQNLQEEANVIETFAKQSFPALIIILSDAFIKTKRFAKLIKLAMANETSIVLVDSVEDFAEFPSSETIDSLDTEVRSVFSNPVVPYFNTENGATECWRSIDDQLSKKALELKKVQDTFLIYKGAIGHHIALVTSLVLNPSQDNVHIPLTRMETLSQLKQSSCCYFIVTNESLKDDDCLQEFYIALNSKKIVIAIQYSAFKPLDIPENLLAIISTLPTLTYKTISTESFKSLLGSKIDMTETPFLLFNKHQLKTPEAELNKIENKIKEIENIVLQKEYVLGVETELNSDGALEIVVYVLDMDKAEQDNLSELLVKEDDIKVRISEALVANECTELQDSIPEEWRKAYTPVSIGMAIGANGAWGTLGPVLSIDQQSCFIASGHGFMASPSLHHPNSVCDGYKISQKVEFVCVDSTMDSSIWSINEPAKFTNEVEFPNQNKSFLHRRNKTTTMKICMNKYHYIDRLQANKDKVYFKTPDGWKEGDVDSGNSIINIQERKLKAKDIITVKMKEALRLGYSGSGLFSARHKSGDNQVCFEGILRAIYTPNKNSKVKDPLAFFVPRETILQRKEQATTAYYYYTNETKYLHSYIDSHKSIYIKKWEGQEIKNTIILDISDLKTLTNYQKDSLNLHLNNIVLVHKVGSCILSDVNVYGTYLSHQLLFKNVIPFFENDLNCNSHFWNCINLKLSKSLAIDLHYDDKQDNSIYLSYLGFLGQQAALITYLELTKQGHNVYNNILYDDVYQEYHEEAAAKARIVIMFLTDTWRKSYEFNSILTKVMEMQKPIVIIQSKDMLSKYNTLDIPTLTYQFPQDIPELLKQLEEKAKLKYTCTAKDFIGAKIAISDPAPAINILYDSNKMEFEGFTFNHNDIDIPLHKQLHLCSEITMADSPSDLILKGSWVAHFDLEFVCSDPNDVRYGGVHFVTEDGTGWTLGWNGNEYQLKYLEYSETSSKSFGMNWRIHCNKKDNSWKFYSDERIIFDKKADQIPNNGLLRFWRDAQTTSMIVKSFVVMDICK